jgi:hypothetical protein
MGKLPTNLFLLAGIASQFPVSALSFSRLTKSQMEVFVNDFPVPYLSKFIVSGFTKFSVSSIA